jgi:hypothetical protein
LALGEFAGVCACNDVGVVYRGRLEFWASLHPEKFGLWAERRRRLGLPPHETILGHVEALTSNPRLPPCVTGYVPHRFPGQNSAGSSGLFALKVALDRFERAVLCGIPLAPAAAHYFDSRPWGAAEHYLDGWHEALPTIKGRARSMSGWTAELLGRPTAEWMAE